MGGHSRSRAIHTAYPIILRDDFHIVVHCKYTLAYLLGNLEILRDKNFGLKEHRGRGVEEEGVVLGERKKGERT